MQRTLAGLFRRAYGPTCKPRCQQAIRPQPARFPSKARHFIDLPVNNDRLAETTIQEKETAAIHENAHRLLEVCGDLKSAQRELKWICEGAKRQVWAAAPAPRDGSREQPHLARRKYVEAYAKAEENVHKRAAGEPLQYLLGTEFFGDIEVLCRPGVLIPRRETASIVTYLAKLLGTARGHKVKGNRFPDELKLLDICTGSGAIPLVFQNAFHRNPNDKTLVRMVGIDISPNAIELAKANVKFVREADRKAYKTWVAENVRRMHPSKLQRLGAAALCRNRSMLSSTWGVADVFCAKGQPHFTTVMRQCHRGKGSKSGQRFDVVISNPPYVSPEEFEKTTEKSVREFEPRGALVPEDDKGEGSEGLAEGSSVPLQDSFYPRLLEVADEVDSKVVLFEVSGKEQAKRVVAYVQAKKWEEGILILRDEPTGLAIGSVETDRGPVTVVGEGNMRAVLAYRDIGRSWLQPLIEEDLAKKRNRLLNREAKRQDEQDGEAKKEPRQQSSIDRNVDEKQGEPLEREATEQGKPDLQEYKPPGGPI